MGALLTRHPARLLQAQIAAEHATAPAAADTNFARIATLYAHLSRVAP